MVRAKSMRGTSYSVFNIKWLLDKPYALAKTFIKLDASVVAYHFF